MATVKKGDRLKHEGGFMGTAGDDAADGEGVAVRLDVGGATYWSSDSFESMMPLVDLVEAAFTATQKGTSLPTITPSKYGFKNSQEYWDAVRKLAGLKP